MKCRCGNEIHNVPDHLAGLAEWICQQCANTPQGSARSLVEPVAEVPVKKKGAVGRPKKAA